MTGTEYENKRVANSVCLVCQQSVLIVRATELVERVTTC